MANLKDQFEKMLHLNWDVFIEMEKDKNISVDESVLCSLIRTCADTDEISATKLAFDRIEGMLEIPIEVKVPKFYTRYMNAKEIEPSTKEIEAPKEAEVESTYDPATAKLRETLHEMRDMPRQVVNMVLATKKAVEKGKPIHNKIPMVKSVIVANLLYNVKKGRLRAIELVFDQIDGKLAKTITLLGGEDLYVPDYVTAVAPAGAIKDENGYYVAENKLMTTQWIRGFSRSQKGLEILAEGLDDV